MQKAIFVAHTAHLAKMAESCAQESSVNCEVVYKALDEIDEPLDLKDYQLVIAYGDYAQDLKAQTDLTILEINPDFVSLLQDIEINVRAIPLSLDDGASGLNVIM